MFRDRADDACIAGLWDTGRFPYRYDEVASAKLNRNIYWREHPNGVADKRSKKNRLQGLKVMRLQDDQPRTIGSGGGVRVFDDVELAHSPLP